MEIKDTEVIVSKKEEPTEKINIKEEHTEKINIIVNDDDNKEWRLCCSHSSKSFIKYIVMVIISIIVLLFSIFMIIDNPEKDNSIYFSLISSILSLYVPAPTLENFNNKI